jgi:thiosulfate/3-mercaptopyruvate sulfurtransferase
MNKATVLTLVIFTLLLSIPYSAARNLPAIVSADWLEQNSTNSKLVIVDIRNRESFEKSHIPGAVLAPFSSWIRNDGNAILELPPEKIIHDLLGNLGIGRESLVVVVNKTDTDWNRADATRVAWTCIVSGVSNASVLDGGYNRWLKLGKPVTADITLPDARTYNGISDQSSLITKSEVMRKIGHSIILDARLPEDYFGVSTGKGHIKSAVNLPAPWAYNTDGTFRNQSDLKAMASGTAGPDTKREIILYCEVGGFASTWWFILSEVLDYPNVRLYDGSFQEWERDPEAPISIFRWN